jgi:hypothetical protein
MKNLPESPKLVEPVDLEFPDWSGMDDRAVRVDTASAFRFVEEYARWFPESVARWRAERPAPCAVEFVL